MTKIRKILLFFLALPKTIWFNFRQLPAPVAIFLPVILSPHIKLISTAGKVIIEGPIRFGMIQIGFERVGIYDPATSRVVWENCGRVIFKGSACIKHGAKISVGKHGMLELGARFEISTNSALICHKEIVIGDDFLMSWGATIMDTDFHRIFNQKNQQINEDLKVIIGNKVWVGLESVILKGSVIADGSVVGARALVAGVFIEPGQLLLGHPAAPVSSVFKWST